MTTPSNISAMNAAIDCNNIACEAIQNGHIDDASNAFTATAKFMLPLSRTIGTDEPLDNNVPSEKAIKSGMDELYEITDYMKTSILNNDSTRMPHDDTEIYSMPLTLAHHMQEPMSCSREAAVILYNMGLAYHLQRSQECLQKALCFYNLAYNMTHEIADDEALSQKLIMVTTNNTAMIYHCMGEFDVSRQYLESLQGFIESLSEICTKEEMNDRRYFMINAMYLQPPQTASAA